MKGFWKSIQVLISLPVRLILAWFIAHIMAIFGIFTIVAYPVWVLAFPKNGICWGCRLSEDGEECRFCNEKVKANEFYPKNGRSIVINTLLLLLITILSIGVVYLEKAIIDRAGILNGLKTVTFNIPSKSQYRINEIFPMRIEITQINTAINVVQADLTFDPDLLEVLDVSTKLSFTPIIIQKDINNTLGYVRLTGGIPSPGYSQSEGLFGVIYFKAKTAGLATVSFLPTSLVLADDGKGTNILKNYPTVSYVIRPDYVPEDEEVSQREIFKQEVLGTTTEEDIKGIACKVDLSGSVINDVLGASDSILDQATLDEIAESKTAKKAFFTILLDVIHVVDSFIINIYHTVIDSVFTN